MADKEAIIEKFRRVIQDEYVALHRQYQKKFLIVESALIILVSSLFAYIWHDNSNATIDILFLFVWAAPLVYPFALNFEFKKKLRAAYKTTISHLFPLLSVYKAEFDEKLLHESNLFSTFADASSSDIIGGIHQDVKYVMGNLLLENVSVQGDFANRFAFSGVCFYFKIPKFFDRHTIVSSKYDYNIHNSWFLSMFSVPSVLLLAYIIYGAWKLIQKTDWHNRRDAGMLIFCLVLFIIIPTIIGICCRVYNTLAYRKRLEQVKLEDIGFSEQYKVYTEDTDTDPTLKAEHQIEARTVINPVLMDKLNRIQTAFGTKRLKCAFWKDNVMLAVTAGREFYRTYGLLSRPDAQQEAERLYGVLTSANELIDFFKSEVHK